MLRLMVGVFRAWMRQLASNGGCYSLLLDIGLWAAASTNTAADILANTIGLRRGLGVVSFRFNPVQRGNLNHHTTISYRCVTSHIALSHSQMF